MLAAGHVHADHGDVGGPAQGAGDRVGQGHRVAGVGQGHGVGQPGGVQPVALVEGGHDPNDGGGTGVAGRGQRQRAALAGPAEHRHRRRPVGQVLPDHPGGQRGCAAHVQHRQRQGGIQVVGQDRRGRAGEQDGVAAAGHLLAVAAPAGQLVGDRQRGQGQRDQGGDPVAGAQAQRRVGTDLVHRADEHAAGAGDRVVHLAPLCDDLAYVAAHRRAVPAVGLAQLAEARRVQIQPLHRHPHLVGADVRMRVQPPCGLRQHPHRLPDPMQSDGRIHVPGLLACNIFVLVAY